MKKDKVYKNFSQRRQGRQKNYSFSCILSNLCHLSKIKARCFPKQTQNIFSQSTPSSQRDLLAFFAVFALLARGKIANSLIAQQFEDSKKILQPVNWPALPH